MFAAYRARRLGALGLLTTIIVLAASPARGGCFASLTPSAGDPFIDCSFGIEHWEAGKRRDERYQQWHLTCRTPPRGQTSCELERVIYDMWSKDVGGVHVSFDKHSTEDGTLQLVDGRWEQGTLDFDVVMGTMTKDVCHVAMRIEVKELLVTLKSFKAVGVGRGGLFGLPDGNVVAVEYRIPDYSYTVNMQITLEGLKSEQEKRYDDLMKDLSADDRKAWTRMNGKCLDMRKADERQLVKRLPPDLQKKAKAAKDTTNFSPDEEARFKKVAAEWARQQMDKCLQDAGMSEAGRERVTAYFRADMAE